MARSRTKKQYAVAGGTFAVALAIGFIMQYGDAFAARFASDEPTDTPQSQLEPDVAIIPVAASMAVPTTLEMPSARLPHLEQASYDTTMDEIKAPSMAVPSVNDIATTSADHLMLKVIDSTLDADSEAELLAEVAEFCEATMTASPTDLAMVNLQISNVCRPNAVVAIHHQGMMFNAVTDELGNLDITVPALAKDAFFIAAFDDDEGAVAMTDVPSLALFDRAVVQWQGENTVELHAFEFGATYGDTGHIWAKAAADPQKAADGTGGFLTLLGNDAAENALMAEVYTFPSGTTLVDGGVNLRVEAEVTARNCGRKIEAQSIQVMPGADAMSVDLVVTMPDCDAVGEYLLLKNMYQDLTLAAK